jgi:hypothetical protein
VPNGDLDASRSRPFDEITKRSHFSSEPAQIEPSYMFSPEQPPHGFLMRNAFAAVPLEPDAGFRHGLLLFFRLGLVVDRCVAQSTGSGFPPNLPKLTK